ncbi:MAG: hypothetical protein EPN20_06400 [Magnetospirillum sp.]|nr:MAG: hypothetical protein EPN20_06400 [Magnetospirillum sp.]
MLERAAGQLRVAGSAITGLDLAACLSLGAALGYDSRAMAELLPFAEAGLVEGLASQHTDESTDHGDP